MAFSRRLGVVSILSACWLVAAVGCSDDEDRKGNSGEAGEGGDDGGGKGGTPSGGGNSNNGGNAGNGGSNTAGSAGDAGSGSGGDAGNGSGGDAGGGGIVAGAGGEGGSGVVGGAGGEGGSGVVGGAGGEGGEPVALAQSCVSKCETDADCVRDGDTPGECNDVTKTCEEPTTMACATHDDCGPSTLFWYFGCSTSADCDLGYECVDYRGKVYCAIAADPDFGCDVYEVVTTTLHDGGEDVEVCVDPNARCSEGKCRPNCEDVPCDADEGDTCNPVTGRCECQNGTECGTGVCTNNLCTECAIDDDCAASAAQTGHDKCVAGKCGCGDSTSCSENYPEATLACQ